MAEWLCSGLQNRGPRFDSGLSLQIKLKYCVCPGGGIGRRKGLKIPRLNRRAGSIPAPGTICDLSNIFYLKLIKVSKTIASFIVKPVHISDKIPLEFLHITGDI